MIIPQSPEQITAEWLTAALRSNNVIADESVTAFTLDKPSGEDGRYNGVIGVSYKMELSYSADVPTAPRTLFVKLSNPRHGVGAAGSYQKEVRFYQEFAEASNIRVPKCYYSNIDMSTGLHVLLLENIEDVQPASTVEKNSLDYAEQVVVSIAKFHATWWGNPVLDSWRPEKYADRYQVAMNFQNTWEGLISTKLDAPLPPALEAIRERIGVAIEYLYSTHQQTPQTLIHFDLHTENLLFPTDDSPVVFIDWQSMQAGRGAVDVAYYLTSQLSATDRREHDMRLLRLYYDTLLANGVSDYSFDMCYHDYCLGVFRGLYVVGVVIYYGFIPTQEGATRFWDTNLPKLEAFISDHKIATTLMPQIPTPKPRETDANPKDE